MSNSRWPFGDDVLHGELVCLKCKGKLRKEYFPDNAYYCENENCERFDLQTMSALRLKTQEIERLQK